MSFNLTLVAQFVTFVLFIFFTKFFVWPHILRAIETRQKQIAEGLAAAEQGKQSLSNSARQAELTVAEARARAGEIIAQAEKRSAQLVDEARNAAREEGSREKAAAQAEIEQEVSRAREMLREQVAALAVAGAEKILRREVDAQAHGDLIAELKSQI